MFQELLPTRPATPPTAQPFTPSAKHLVRGSVDAGAPRQAGGPWRLGLVQLLNDALATQLVGMLRYKRHHFTAQGVSSSPVAEAFRVHADTGSAHADRLAHRIVQLGGQPDFAPESLGRRSHVAYDGSTHLQAMLRANLAAEHAVIEATTQLVALVREQDPTTRRLLEDILADATQHAHALQGGLADPAAPPRKLPAHVHNGETS
jgi:bacterioferritin